MKLTIEVHHIVSFDPKVVALLETIFPNQAIVNSLTKDIQDKTSTLQAAVTENTPAG